MQIWGGIIYQGVIRLLFFNKEKSNKHKSELCMKVVTDWNCLLKEMSSQGSSRAAEIAGGQTPFLVLDFYFWRRV